MTPQEQISKLIQAYGLPVVVDCLAVACRDNEELSTRYEVAERWHKYADHFELTAEDLRKY